MMEEPCNVSLPGPAQPLSDLLEQLPVDVVQSNVWQRLLDSKASFRQTSLPCALLADLLCTSVTLHDSHQHEREYEPNQLKEEEVEPWHQAAQDRAAYLARLPRLTSLELQGWPGEAALVALLTEYGAATGGRLAKLVLRSGPTLSPPLTIASACAIRLACPALTDLELDCTDADEAADRALVGDLLRPLCDVPLSSLILTGSWSIGEHSLRSLRDMSHLCRLELRLAGLLPQHLLALAHLTHLRDLRLGHPTHGVFHLGDLLALRSLSRLTRLELLALEHSALDEPPEPGTDAAQQLAAGLASLAGLTQLEHLAFRLDFVVGDLIFSALRHLSRLTRLDVGQLQVTQPAAPGHLPRLRHLNVPCRPSNLLRTLSPLLPLPSLESITSAEQELCLHASCDNPNTNAQLAAALALKRTLQQLAAAPLLRLRDLELIFSAVYPIPLLGLAEGLQPLAQHLTALQFEGHPSFGAEFVVLRTYLPNLKRLSLEQCTLAEGGPAAVLSCWPSLREVRLVACEGMTAEAWLALAALRAEPLRVEADPVPPAPLMLRCGAVQARLFGCQNLWFGRL